MTPDINYFDTIATPAIAWFPAVVQYWPFAEIANVSVNKKATDNDVYSEYSTGFK